MPAKIALRTGVVRHFTVPFALIGTKGRVTYLSVATESDGLIDGPEEVLAAAKAWREEMESPIRGRIDINAIPGNDISNSCPPSNGARLS